MISKRAKISSTQLATNWSISVTQYIPAYPTHTHTHTHTHTGPINLTFVGQEWHKERLTLRGLPVWHMAGQGDRGWNMSLPSVRRVCVWRVSGRRLTGRWWSPLITRRDVRTQDVSICWNRSGLSVVAESHPTYSCKLGVQTYSQEHEEE